MKTTIEKPKKNFDSIKVMREIRDEIRLEIMNMNYEQEREYLDNLLSKKHTLPEKI